MSRLNPPRAKRPSPGSLAVYGADSTDLGDDVQGVDENFDIQNGGQNSPFKPHAFRPPRQIFVVPSRVPNVALSEDERLDVVRVFQKLRLTSNAASSETASLLDVSLKTVERILASYNKNAGILLPFSPGNTGNHAILLIGREDLGKAVRAEMTFNADRKFYTSARGLWKTLKTTIALPGCYSTFLRYLKASGFVFGAPRGHSFDDTKLLAERSAYIQAYNMNAALPDWSRKVPVFQDESYCHQHHHGASAWYDEKTPSTRIQGVRHKGNRFCFSACITSEGVLPNSVWLFDPGPAAKKQRDYHKSFSSVNFYEYFTGKGLVQCDGHAVGMVEQFEMEFGRTKKALFILDNASYHKTISNFPPGTATKAVIAAFLGVPDTTKTKAMLLLDLASRKLNEKADIVKYAESRGHAVLFTPPYHSDLQPIELYWADIKNEVSRSYSNERPMSVLKTLLSELFVKYGTKANIVKKIQHSEKVLEEFRLLEGKLEGLDDEEGEEISSEDEE